MLKHSCWSYPFSPMVSDEVVDNCHSKAEEIYDSKELRDSNIGAAIKPCKENHFLVHCIVGLWNFMAEVIHSFWLMEFILFFVGRTKEGEKKRKKEIKNSPEKREEDPQDEILLISSRDDDCSNGIKSMNCFFKIITLLL